jgi:hypothetical protein
VIPWVQSPVTILPKEKEMKKKKKWELWPVEIDSTYQEEIRLLLHSGSKSCYWTPKTILKSSLHSEQLGAKCRNQCPLESPFNKMKTFKDLS